MIHVEQLTSAVAERDGQIASLNQAVTERDGQIASLNQAVDRAATARSPASTKP